MENIKFLGSCISSLACLDSYVKLPQIEGDIKQPRKPNKITFEQNMSYSRGYNIVPQDAVGDMKLTDSSCG